MSLPSFKSMRNMKLINSLLEQTDMFKLCLACLIRESFNYYLNCNVDLTQDDKVTKYFFGF